MTRKVAARKEHHAGVTLGTPTTDEVGTGARPGWRPMCSCGWYGKSTTDAIRAQDEALSHAAGADVRRSIIQRTSWRQAGRTWRGGWARTR